MAQPPDSDNPSLGRHTPFYGQIVRGGMAAPTLALFIDRPHLRDQVREDAAIAGYRIVATGTLDDFTSAARPVRAAVVLIDCPSPGAAALVALARQDIDTRASGAQLIVNTSLDGLEDVFGCLDQSRPQLLVDASPADLAIALGRALAFAGAGRVRELADEDRRQLLRLAEQISSLAARLDRYEEERSERGPDRLEAPALPFRGAGDEGGTLGAGPPSPSTPQLPAPHLLRQILRQRSLRASFLGADLFADPAWDMLLDLTAARGEKKRVAVTSLCIASGVPATTALRWIGQMIHLGLFLRIEDQADRRRAFIDLTDKAVAGMAAYFAALDEGVKVAGFRP